MHTYTPQPLLILSTFVVLCTSACGPCTPSSVDPTPSMETSGKPSKEDLKSKFVPEKEPNDLAKDATPFLLIAQSPGSPLVKPLEGTLSSARDIDYIAIPPAPADTTQRTLTLSSTSSPGGDLVLQWGDNPTHLQNFTTGSEPEVVPNLSPNALLIAVRPGPDATFPLAYRLDLAQNPSAIASLHPEASPEDPPFALTIPGDLQGLLNYRGDQDVFTLASPNAKPIDVRLELQPPPKPATLPLMVSLRDASNAPIWSAQLHPDSPHDALVFPALRISPDAPLTLTIRALHDAKDPQSGPAGSSHAYTLRVLPLPPSPEGTTVDVEPSSEETPIAVPLRRKRAAISGTLANRADRDAFLIQTPKSSTDEPWLMTANLKGDTIDMGLMMRQGLEESARRTDAAGNPADQVESICLWSVPADVPLTLGVYAENPRQEGADPSGAYTLSVRFQRPQPGAEVEPNNTTGQESTLELGKTAHGTLFSPEDIDLFSLLIGEERDRPRVIIPDPRKTPSPTPKATDVEGSERPTEAPTKKGGISSVLERLVGNREEGDLPQKNETPSSDPDEDALTLIEVVWSARNVDASLELLDEDGVLVARSDQPGAGRSETLRVSLPRGVYTVRVVYRGGDILCEDVYTLTARVVEP